MNTVAKIEQPAAPAPVAESSAIISMIERVARDPNSNIEKVREMLALRRQEQDYDAKRAYSAALSAMQPELPVIKERGEVRHDKNKPAQFTYARWEDINDAIRPHLARHGFALSFRTGRDGDKIVVTGVLSHREGHSEETTMHLPIDTGPGRNAVQSVGSSTSYGKRYTASALLNLTSRNEDDDGTGAISNEPVSDEQAAKITALLTETKSNLAIFLKWIGAESVSDIPARKFKAAIDGLEVKKRSQQ